MLALKRFLNLRRGRIDARKEVRKQLRLRSRLESDVNKKINTLFRTQLKKTSNQYQITTRFDSEIFVRETSAMMEAVMHQHYKKIFRIVYRDNEELYDRGRKDEELFVFGRSKDFERIVNEYFRSRTPYFAGMSTVMSRAIQKVIEQGRLENLSLAQITRNIDGLTKVGRSRAALIARTETHNAASFANHQYHKTASEEYGIEMLKRWVSTSDLRTRSAHNLANGQTVPMDEKFTVGGAKMDYAGDPAGGARNVVNCRCVIIYVEPEDEENITDEQIKPTVDQKPPTQVERTPPPLTDADIDISLESQQRWLDKPVPFNTPPEKIREMIREAIEAQTAIIDDIYGATIPAELAWHKGANHWVGETDILNSLKKVAPLTKVFNKGSGAKFAVSHKVRVDYAPAINMGANRSVKNKKGAITFRHEYGHHIDHDINLIEKYRQAKRSTFERQGKDRLQIAFSREAADEFVEDGAKLMRLQQEAEQRYLKTFSNDLNPFEQGDGYMFFDEIGFQLSSTSYGDYVYADSFLKKLGLSVTQKQFRDEIQGTRTRRKRVGLAEKLQRDVDFDTFQTNIKNILNNSPHSPFDYEDLQKMLGNDFLLKIDQTGDYYTLVNVIAKMQSGYDKDFYNLISSLSNAFDKQKFLLGKEALYFDDYLGSITKGKYTTGHGTVYYKDKLSVGMRQIDNTIPIKLENLSETAKAYLEKELGSVNKNMTTEAFANYIALLGGENAQFWRRLMMLYAPQTTRKFDAIIRFINGIDD